MSKYGKYCKGLLLACLTSLLLAGCGSGGDTLSTGYYKEAAIKANGEFVIKDKVDDDKAKKGGTYFYVELGKEGSTKDKITSVTAMAGGVPIDIIWKQAEGNERFGVLSKVTVDYSQEGFIKETYLKTDGNKGNGPRGESSIRYKIAQDGENKGRLERIYYYNKDGDNQINQNLSQATVSYNNNGQISEITYLDKDGNKSVDLKGANKLGFLYDKEKPEQFIGYEIRNHNGTPINNGFKYSRILYEYDKNGRIISKKLINTSGQLDGSAYRAIPISLYNIESLRSELSMIRQGILTSSAETKYTYDEKHSGPVSISFLGIDGQPQASELGLIGVAGLDISYDDNDNIIDLKFIGTDGQIVATDLNGIKGPDEIKLEYDDKGNISKLSFFRNGELVAQPLYKEESKTNTAAIQFKYDEQRRVTEISYLDKTGNATYKTIYGNVKYYGIKYDYTLKNRQTIYLDASGQEFKPNPSDILIGTWFGLHENINMTWTFNTDGTFTITDPGNKKATFSYNTSDVNIRSAGRGSITINWTNNEVKNATGSTELTFTDGDNFEVDGDTFHRKIN